MISLTSPARSRIVRHAYPPMEIWRARHLLWNLVLRNLRIKYQHSFLGFVWTLLNPLLTIAVLVGVFRFVVRLEVPHYWAFLLSGYFVWSFVSQSLMAATAVLPEHAHLARSVPFPAEVLVLAAVLSRSVEFALELTITVMLLVTFHHHGLPLALLWLLPLALLHLALVFGLTLGISTLSVFFHDVQHALPIGLMILFYASPIFYPAELVPEKALPVYLLNPFASLLTMFQSVLYRGEAPDLRIFGAAAALAVAIAALGYAIFRRYRSVFAEIV
ncbi:MAG TPA: ABC transporter permease [Thermoanaerobaculia bacterium]|nr:ABC transporter permease [Thermoanaerobaculia bacterium]